MMTHLMARATVQAAFALSLVVGAAGCANTSIGTKIDDSTITTKVKTAMLADSNVSGTKISVETVDGVVQLSGFLDSAAEAARAEAIARSTDGVRRVENKITVRR